MLTNAASEEESHPPPPVVSKKGRNRKSRQVKSKANAKSEESDTADDMSTKSVAVRELKDLRNRRKDHNLLLRNRILS